MVVVLYTTKDEDITVTEVGLEAIQAKGLFGQLGFEWNKIELWCINQEKHVKVRFQLIPNIVSEGVVAMEDFHAEDNLMNR